MLEFRELTTDDEISSAFPLMHELRPQLIADAFLKSVRTQQQDGYRLFAGVIDSGHVVLAGVRDAQTLMRGPHLFVDDLVTSAACRGRGHGAAMLRWLAGYAAGRGLRRIYLDSRDTAVGFYRKVGFTLLTAVPCWIDVES